MKAKPNPLKIVMWEIDKLIPYEKNPRKNDHAVDQMAGLIKEFGFVVPMLAKSTGHIVDGHLRWKAARRIEMTHVPVIECDTWTEAQIKAFRIAVNRSATFADWDEKLLAAEFIDLNTQAVDLSLTGFDIAEIADIVTGVFTPKTKSTKAAGSTADGLQFRVVVDCAGEQHQAELLAKFKGDGLVCRPLIS